MTDAFSVRFWGVRGSIACPGPHTQRYGGNTSCVEVVCGEHRIILDGGTGLRALGNHLVTTGPVSADMLFTHTHFDHVCGIPFFAPFFHEQNDFRIWAGHLPPGSGIHRTLQEMMTAPLFPAPLDVFRAGLEYIDFRAGKTLELQPGVQVRTAPLNHPNEATGYRIDFDGRSVCYITDTEHLPGALDQNILELINSSDLLIYDATYSDEEFEQYKGWGHSTWQQGVRLAEEAGVGALVIFHHDPNKDDDDMDRIAHLVKKMRPGSIVASEGMVLVP